MPQAEPAATQDPLHQPYLLVTNIPCYVDAQGTAYLDRSWHHDFVEHLNYLPQLRIACPSLKLDSTQHGLDLMPVQDQAHRFIQLKPQTTLLKAALTLPQTAWTLVRAVNEARIVHSSVAGWPYPLGWIASALARMKGRPLVVIVESAPWRASDVSERRRLSQRVRGVVYEHLAKWSCRQADLALFTQPSYQQQLHQRARGQSYVTPATWIRDEFLLDAKAAEAAWQKRCQTGPRLLFAGRLAHEKGVHTLLQALDLLESQHVELTVDFVGEGSCADAIDQRTASLTHVCVQRLKPRSYGATFFSLLDAYHAVLVPSLSDEQPRIIFDAAARALGAIASSTDGLRSLIQDGVTGQLVPPGDPDALAAAMRELAQATGRARSWGVAALEQARPHTHTAMHERRAELLRDMCQSLMRAPTPPQVRPAAT